MARLTNLIERQEYTKAHSDGRNGHAVSKFIIHTADGSYEGTISWQKNAPAGKRVSSTFINGKEPGEVCQMVDTDDAPWTQSSANNTSVSAENAGWGDKGEPLTAWQIEQCAQQYAACHLLYPNTLPLKLMANANDSGLGWHGMGGDAWGGHYNCPGKVIVAQLPEILARAIEIVSGGVSGGTDDMFCNYGDKNDKVTAMQLQLLDVDPHCLPKYGADGDYGNECCSAVSRLLTGGEGKKYGPAEFALLQKLVAQAQVKAVTVDLPETIHVEGDLPITVTGK